MTIRNLPAGIALPAYLESLQQNGRFKDCRELYTSTQARIPLQVQARKEQKQQRPGEPESQQPEPPCEPPVEVLEGLRDAVKAHRQVLLIGKPGSGKTTALRRLVWEGVSAWVSEAVNESALPIPVLVELRELREGTVEALVRRTLRRHRQQLNATEIEDLLFDGQVCVLFDGVNELPSADAWAKVSDFQRNHPDTPMIFSTRSLGAGADLGIAHKLEMVPLTEPQMHEFVSKRLPDDQAKTLLQQLGGRLRELAETPLLLAMLCEVFEQDGQIPRSRGELFRTKFSQQYAAFKPLREQPVSEDFRRLAPELLKHLAFAMMQGDPPTEFRLQIPKAEAETLLQTYLSAHQETNTASRAREYLEDLLEHHLLQLAANPDEVEFHHQLFQEYYAAEALLPKLPTLTEDQLKCHYLNYLKWTEPLAIALSLIEEENQALKVVKLALDTDLMLGAELAGAANPKFHASTIEQVINREIPSPSKIDLLGHTKSPVAIPLLLEALKDSNHVIRLSAVMGLGRIANREATQGLLQALKDSTSIVVRCAERILTELDHEAAIPDLLILLKDQNVDFRQRAVSALSQLNDSKLIPKFLLALEDSEAKVRLSVIKALVRLNDRNTVPNLLSVASQDSDSAVRSSAIKALVNLDDKNIVPDLVLMLQDPDSWVRRAIAEALGELGSKTAIPNLLQALRDSDFAVCESAAKSLGKLGDSTAIPDLVRVLKNSDLHVRRNTAKLLGLLGSNAAIPGLLVALDDLDPYVRQNAVKSLGKVGEGDERAISGLLKSLEDLNPDVSSSAAEALGALNSREAAPVLARIFRDRDKDSNVRSGMLKALAQINNEEVIPVLLEALEDSDFYVQLSAIECARYLPVEQAILKLRKILLDSHNFYIAILNDS